MNSRTYFIGFECEARPDWKELAIAPTAPSNWKDQIKIDRYVAEATERLEAEARFQPLLGFVKEAVVLNENGDIIIRGPGQEVYREINLNRRHLKLDMLTIFGIRPRTRLHQCAVDAALSGKLGDTWGLMARSLFGPKEIIEHLSFVDPVKVMTGGEYEDAQVSIISRLAKEILSPDSIDCAIPRSALAEALRVKSMVEAFGMDGSLV